MTDYIYRTVHLANRNLLYIMMHADNRPAEALVSSSATVSVVDRALTTARNMCTGRPINVQGYNGSRWKLQQWTIVHSASTL